MKAGRPRNAEKDAYAVRYGLTRMQRRRLKRSTLQQLDNCKDEAARRLLLGKSRRVA